jgi:hypothetical protein
MATRAVEHMFTGTTTAYTSYDSTKTVLGKWIQQKTGSLATDKYAGPFPVSLVRPLENSTGIPGVFPHVIDLGNGTHWVFLADNASAAVTRRIICYTFNTATQAWSWRGFLTLTYPSATNHTIRGMKVQRHLHTTGTVTVAGTAVTGNSTTFSTSRIGVGARIGFGSTNPNNITTWYYITAIGSDTSITLGSSVTVGAGSSYVIEELRVYTATTNATAANGGLFVAKGINFDDFTSGGTTISAASATDNQKAVYWLADASTVLNTGAGGLSFGAAAATDTNHDIYVINADTATSLRIYKYNGRVTLAGLASGKSTSAFVLRTGGQTVTGTISQTSASRICTASHGPGSGVSNLYGATTTRIYRVPEASIVDASTNFVADSMNEIPTGSTNTYVPTSGLTSVEYMPTIDRFLITTGASGRHYVTVYQNSGASFDRVFLSDNKQIDQSAADSGLVPYPSTQSAGFSVWVEDGIAYMARVGTTVIINQVYAVPLAADWDWASATVKQRLITPQLTTTGCRTFKHLSVQHMEYYGDSAFAVNPEPWRAYYRTAGISDDSGSWTLVNDTGDLSGIAADQIQFMFEFKTIGLVCLPARLYGLICSYEDSSTDSHYQPSVKHSDRTTKRFAWRFSVAFGSTVPTLTLRLYNAVTGALLLTDTTATAASGTFEKTTNDGGAWGAYDTSDKGNETTYVRYTPTSIGDNIVVYGILSQG